MICGRHLLLLGYLVVAGIVLQPSPARAGPDPTWVSYHDGRSHGCDWAYGIGVDQAHNVYVVGLSADPTTLWDEIIVKCDPAGDTLWTRRYSSSGYDVASDLGFDRDTNLYVTGTYNNDISTLKYSPDGTLVWASLYNGGDNDGGNALTVDPDGNVYVVGSTWQSGGWHIITMRVKPSGDTGWVRVCNGGQGWDNGRAIARDLNGDIVVTGYSTSTLHDCITIKYDTAGNQLWAARYDGPTNGSDEGYALAIDSSNNVIVAAHSDGGSSTLYDFLTIKYDADGDTLWTRRYDGSGHSADYPSGIVADRQNNVFVTGQSSSSSGHYDYATIKYDSLGNQQWVRTYNGPSDSTDQPRGIVIDPHGRIIVTGYSYATTADYFTICYTPDGDTAWTARFDESYNNYDEANSLAVDGDAVYVTGRSITAPNNYDIATVRYDIPSGLAAPARTGVRTALACSPNPFRTALTIELDGIPDALVRVFDMSGREIKSFRAVSGRVRWDGCDAAGQPVSPGVYGLLAQTSNRHLQALVTKL